MSGIDYIYYCFVRSWPLSMSSMPVFYDSGSVLKLNVTFRYERYVVENVTRGMIRSGWKGYSDSFDPWMGRYGDLGSGDLGYAPMTDDYVKPTVTSDREPTWDATLGLYEEKEDGTINVPNPKSWTDMINFSGSHGGLSF